MYRVKEYHEKLFIAGLIFDFYVGPTGKLISLNADLKQRIKHPDIQFKDNVQVKDFIYGSLPHIKNNNQMIIDAEEESLYIEFYDSDILFEFITFLEKNNNLYLDLTDLEILGRQCVTWNNF